ncbi:PREDICTED: lipopolysaccharide-induced tumor necrosis factor-alpha factor homolog isoform X3 [Wasmannia auropunctata]|uniref:lipopolysaccharide-induced tumor necrosis factor-alpha factor homolog isoform X3 n=2 Tax=Wasmannia auropunctata TaxID=64793 RepID=UPI0005ED865F|nr:PREDICTED: lipopolysaccharide-induced tumor necrosis factor-alpha factor homolog isoform X3 [Wasmannia auropunctata]
MQSVNSHWIYCFLRSIDRLFMKDDVDNDDNDDDDGNLDIPSSRDAPPTYSSIFTDSLSHEFTIPINDRSFILARIPPPTYTQAQGIGLMERSDPFVSVSPNATSVWPRVPAATICPRCSALIITVVVVRRSTITHLTALTLFLLGCWPCCMIPYCMDSCNNTDHYCPICRAYLGTYTP